MTSTDAGFAAKAALIPASSQRIQRRRSMRFSMTKRSEKHRLAQRRLRLQQADRSRERRLPRAEIRLEHRLPAREIAVPAEESCVVRVVELHAQTGGCVR